MVDSQEHSKRLQGQRLKQLYKKLNLTQAELAEIAETDQESISMAVNGKRNVQEVWLYKLKQKYNHVNLTWVLDGQGGMFAGSALHDSPHFGEPLEGYALATPLNTTPLQPEEVAAMLARVQKEQADTRAWRAEMEEKIADLVRRLKGIQEGL